MKFTLLFFLLPFSCKTFSPMAPKFHNCDPVDVNDSSPNNKEVFASRGRGRVIGRGRGRDRCRGRGGRGGRGSRRHEEAPTSSYASMHEPRNDIFVKLQSFVDGLISSTPL